MSITIKKAKLKGRRLTLDYFRSVEGGSDTISVKCANQVHPDLLAAMDKLIPHFILLCELPESTSLAIELIARQMDEIDVSEFPKIQVTGFSIGGDDEDEGLTIIGSRLLEKGKTLNINSPFTKYDVEDYQYADELNLAVQINSWICSKIRTQMQMIRLLHPEKKYRYRKNRKKAERKNKLNLKRFLQLKCYGTKTSIYRKNRKGISSTV